jgi:serine/threonine protein kinase/Tol biopolymer transport system component
VDGERWQRIDALVQTAVELEPDRRAAFLDEACAGDEDLRAHVERLLSYDERTFALIESPAAEIAVDLFAAAEPALSAGQRLGRYEVLDFVGAGGMGEVYRARDADLGRTVALKLLPPDFTSDDDRVRRFQAEARAASSLNHPNIITVYEIGRDDDKQFIATEFIEGETLRERMERGQLAAREAVRIAVQAAEALAAAHVAGIVHRDVKPENIMVRPDGYLKVLDFGLAKLTEQESPLSNVGLPGAVTSDSVVGLVMGTVRYMSPEQARGEALDARSDLFSLGVVLYEMIAGCVPFDGETSHDVIAAILHAEPAVLRKRAPEVPAEMERIVATCLRTSKSERYQTTEQLLADLNALARALDLEAGSTADTSTTPRRSRALASAKAGGAAIGALVLVGLTAYLAVSSSARRPEPLRSITKTAIPGSEKIGTAAISPDGRYVVETFMAKDDELWVRDLATGSRERIVASGVALAPTPTFSPDSTSIYYGVEESGGPGGTPAFTIYRIPVPGGDPQKVLEGSYGPVGVSPDGSRLAFVRVGEGESTNLEVCNADGAGERTVATRRPPDFFHASPTWSPNGRSITCGTGSTGLIDVSTEDGTERPIAAGSLGAIKAVWLADGRGLLALAAEQGQDIHQIWYVTYPDGQPRNVTNDLDNYVTFSVTADGGTLVGVQAGATSNLWVAPRGELTQARQITDGRFNSYNQVAWTPDGRIVCPLVTNGVRDLWLVSADGSDRRQLTFGMDTRWPAVSPDGRYLLFTSKRTGNGEIWRVDADGGNPTRLADGFAPTCTPDGWVVYFGAGTLWKVPVEGGAPVRLTDKPSSSPYASPDGTLVACGYQDDPAKPDRVGIVSVADGRLVRTLDMEPTFPLRWTPDGSELIYAADGGIWSRPIAGGPPRRLIAFGSDGPGGFDMSRDGTFVYSRSVPYRDAVVIRSLP